MTGRAFRFRAIVSSFIVGAAIVTSACGGESTANAAADTTTTSAPTTVDIQTIRVSESVLESALEISGTLAPRTRVGVQPKLPGRLERVLVDIGDRVSAGQVVATIERREVDAQLDAARAAVAVAEAGLESAEAGLANAVVEHQRAQTLFEAGALPRQRLDAAETARRAATAQRELAKATIAQAEASVRRAREVQRDTTLTAPVAGFIVARNYDAGAIPGDLPVVVVADLRELKLEAGVSELEAGRLTVGLPAHVTVQAKPGQRFPGKLAAIAPEVDERNRHFRIDVRVPNPNGTLLAGMYATARLVVANVDRALAIPREAVTSRDGKRIALKVVGDTLTPVEIVEGLTDGSRVQIVSGLSSGDQVLADARRQLPAGARVKAVDLPAH
jgi:RND family efflux transporter MFP subunit